MNVETQKASSTFLFFIVSGKEFDEAVGVVKQRSLEATIKDLGEILADITIGSGKKVGKQQTNTRHI